MTFRIWGWWHRRHGPAPTDAEIARAAAEARLESTDELSAEAQHLARRFEKHLRENNFAAMFTVAFGKRR